MSQHHRRNVRIQHWCWIFPRRKVTFHSNNVHCKMLAHDWSLGQIPEESLFCSQGADVTFAKMLQYEIGHCQHGVTYQWSTSTTRCRKTKTILLLYQSNQSNWFLMYLTKCFRGSCHGFQAKSYATFILTAISIWLSSPALLFCRRAEFRWLSTWHGFILRAAPIFFPHHSELSENKIWLLCCSPALYMNCMAANRSTSHVL